MQTLALLKDPPEWFLPVPQQPVPFSSSFKHSEGLVQKLAQVVFVQETFVSSTPPVLPVELHHHYHSPFLPTHGNFKCTLSQIQPVLKPPQFNPHFVFFWVSIEGMIIILETIYGLIDGNFLLRIVCL